MDSERDEITVVESQALEDESRLARSLDVELAAGMRHHPPVGATSARGYLRALSGRQHLAPEAELRLVKAAQHGDQRAREELVERFLPHIAGTARIYRGSDRIARLELMQEGVVGLLRALERFDPAIGASFWGYAAWWVRQAMQQLVAELTRPMVMSDRALRQLAQTKTAVREFVQRNGREPSGRELASVTGLSDAQLADLLAVEGMPRSLEEPITGPDGEVGAFGELLYDPLAEGAYERLLDESEIAQVRALLGSLSERERMILRGRYGLDGAEVSLRELGERLGLSRERVRQIEQRALGKLRVIAGGSDGDADDAQDGGTS